MLNRAEAALLRTVSFYELSKAMQRPSTSVMTPSERSASSGSRF